MKRIRQIFLIAMVLPGLFIQAQTIQVRMPNLTATVGDLISVPVYIDNSVTGLNVVSYQLQIYYNSARLAFNNITVTGTMTQTWGTPTYNSSNPNYLNIAGAGTTPLSGTGVLLNITFNCISSGSTALNFNGGTTNNFFNEGTPVMTFVNGFININALPTITVTPNSALLAIGETQQFSVSGGTPPYIWSVTNPSVAGINSSGLLSANAVGFTKVQALDNAGIIDQTDNLIEVRAMKLSLPSVSEWQGGTIEIPINTTSLTGHDIVSGEIRFTFNNNILIPTGFTTSGTLLQSNSNIILNTSMPGQVTIAFAGTTPLSGSGELIRIVFDISSVNTGNSNLNFSTAIFNESLLAKTVNGFFTMITFGTISINPNTYNIVAGQTKQFTASGGVPPYTWSSSDPVVASVDGAGILTAYKSGIIKITAIDNVGAAGVSGNINVYDTYVSLPNVNASLGSQYDIPVLISTLPTGQSVFSIQGSISYKSPELEALDIITSGTMTDGWSFVKSISGNTISFAGAGAISFNSPGAMFKIRFQLKPELTNGENAFVNINNIMLNEGVPLPLTANGSITGVGGIVVSLKAFLEGPFSGTTMDTDLNPWKIPKNQPYNTSPWSYNGTENFGAVPNAEVVDWILIELRQTTSGPSTATPATRISRQAALILKNGNIVGMDGASNLVFGVTITSNLYAIVWHRNHLGIMSAVPLVLSGGIYSYDFTTAANQAYLSGQKSLGGGKYGMYTGNADGNGVVHLDDLIIWSDDAGDSGYFRGDLDLNGQVNNQDKNDIWMPNEGIGDQVPD